MVSINKKISKYSLLLIILLSVTAFPSKYIYYIAPFLIITFSFFIKLIDNKKLFFLLIALLIYIIINYTFSLISGNTYNISGSLIYVLTIIPIIIILSRKKIHIDKKNIQSTQRILFFFIVIQFIVVLFQLSQTKNWDAITGTYGLFDYKYGTTITQVFFTFNILCFIIFIFKEKLNIKSFLIMLCALIMVALAQSGHQTLFFIITFLLVFIKKNDFKGLIKISIIGTVLLSLVIILFPETLDLGSMWFEKTFYNESPKTLITIDSFNILKENTKIILFGVGPGQYTSRASLISSGEYISSTMPDFLTGKSYYFSQYVSPLIQLHKQIGEGSAIAQPYYGLLSILMEFGLPIVILFLFLLTYEVKNLLSLRKYKEIRILCNYNLFFIFFLLFCSMIENYFEFVQAILVPIYLYILSHGRINHFLKEKK